MVKQACTEGSMPNREMVYLVSLMTIQYSGIDFIEFV